MNPHTIIFLMRNIEDVLDTLLLLGILVGGSILWEKIKPKWLERDHSLSVR